MTESLKRDPLPRDCGTWHSLCLIQAATDPDAYRETCHKLLETYRSFAERNKENAPEGWRISACCNFMPIDESDLRDVVTLAEQSYKDDPQGILPKHELACILYRNGEYADSLRLQLEVIATPEKDVGHEFVFLWMAMAAHKDGKTSDAKDYLQTAESLAEERKSSTGYERLADIELKMLLAEARQTLAESQK